MLSISGKTLCIGPVSWANLLTQTPDYIITLLKQSERHWQVNIFQVINRKLYKENLLII